MAEANGIKQLDIPFDFNGISRVINPTLIWDEDNVILIDAGFPGQLPLFRKAIEKLDLSFHCLNKIIITHQDIDHIGGLVEIVNAVGHNVDVLAHELEEPYIQGDEVFVKNPQKSAAQSGAKPKLSFPPFSRAQVTRLVSDGEELPYCGGITVIHTPGHTLGHICLYHKRSKTLITGDALNVEGGQLIGPNPMYTHDLIIAAESLKKLSQYDIQTVICYHGGVYASDVNRHISEIANAGLSQKMV
jgi:glyoxylase-like metal-dependent hydrolase (beta-lactamase superfamily II)